MVTNIDSIVAADTSGQEQEYGVTENHVDTQMENIEVQMEKLALMIEKVDSRIDTLDKINIQLINEAARIWVAQINGKYCKYSIKIKYMFFQEANGKKCFHMIPLVAFLLTGKMP